MNVALILTTLLQTSIDPNNFNGYLVLAYFIMWAIVVVYIITLVLRQRNIEKDIDLLEQLLQEDEESATS